MGFYHRKLLDNTISDIDHCTETYCNTAYDNLLPVCPPSCLTICPGICLFPITTLNSSPPPPPTTPRHIPTLFICMIVFFSASIFLASCLVSVKVYKARRLRRRSQLSNVDDHDHGHDGRDEFFDEVRGPHVLDHPIWYINTVGLEPSVISAITVCKYKRGEGIFIDEGIDSSCAVCLNEFVEDENLRILPKCNHAFHISCIDTWLRSHTNCPMCRAPVVTNTTAGQAPRMLAEPSGTVGNNSAEEGEENSRNSNGELNGEVEGENHQVKSNMVRSVSLDYLSGLKKISGTVALANDAFQLVSNSEIHESSEVCEMGSTSSSSSSSSASTSSSTAEGSRSMRRSVSCGGRFIGSIQSRQN